MRSSTDVSKPPFSAAELNRLAALKKRTDLAPAQLEQELERIEKDAGWHPPPGVSARDRLEQYCAPATPRVALDGARSTSPAVYAKIASARPAHPDVSADLSRLNDTQRLALQDADTHAATLSAVAHASLVNRMTRLGYTEADLAKVLAYVRDQALVTINFQPDKATAPPSGGSPAAAPPLIDALTDGPGRYENQFESLISGGSLGPTAGSMRDGWERTLFRGDYHSHPLVPEERPKYGTIDADGNQGGAAASYGNSYFVLQQGAKSRTTFTPCNSSQAKADDVGTAAHFEGILADQRVSDVELKAIADEALGRPHATVAMGYQYIEAQVHGPVDFSKDVKEVVANITYRGNAVYEPKIRAFAAKYGLPLEWSDGQTVFDDAHAPTSYAFGAPGYAYPYGGMRPTVLGPAAPAGYTVVRYADSVAFVPASAKAAPPSEPPHGYVRVIHPKAGVVLLPERYAGGGTPAPGFSYGATATGFPEPEVAVAPPAPKVYQLPSPWGPAGVMINVVAPAAPEGYTPVRFADSLAFVPMRKDATVPAELPAGYVTSTHPTAGTVLIPIGKPAGSVFGATAAGYPPPWVPLSMTYEFARLGAPAYGTARLEAPPLPAGYTALQLGDGVAFVPTKAGVVPPAVLPPGYVTVSHPTAGTLLVPQRLSSGGGLTPGASFGATATGLPDPVVRLAPVLYTLTTAWGSTFQTPAPPAPPGYTALSFANTVAFVPAVAHPPPADPPPGYVAVTHPTAGKVFLPAGYASGGATPPGLVYGLPAAGYPPPLAKLNPDVAYTSRSYNIPAGAAGGWKTVFAPTPPPNYRPAAFGNDAIAFVPIAPGIPAPSPLPPGYVTIPSPWGGIALAPAALAPGGSPSASHSIGMFVS